MSVPLESLATCFQGLLPAQLFTCSADGMPNAAYLSHVDYVDSTHVALSFQFFNKSRRNITENPQALVVLIDPDSGQGWSLRLRYVRSETTGPLFERMALRIEAIASYCGLKGIFKLRAADIYEVVTVAPVAEEMGILQPDPHAAAAAAASPIFTMNALQDAQRTHSQRRHPRSAGRFDPARARRGFGFSHSMILVPAEEKDVLVTIATRGYSENGAGAEVRFGEGICGMVAEARKPIRISGLMRGMLYALAMHREAQHPERAARRIPLPGLPNPESQLGVPLLVRGELVGVLCVESEVPYRFHEEDKASIELLGSYLAIAVQNMQLQERSTDESRRRGPARPGPGACGRCSSLACAPRAARSRVLRGRRVHHGRRRVPDPQPAGEDPLEAAERARGDRTARVHQPRAAPRQVAEPARMEGQPREPAPAAAPAPRTEVSADRHRLVRPRPLLARRALRAGADDAAVNTSLRQPQSRAITSAGRHALSRALPEDTSSELMPSGSSSAGAPNQLPSEFHCPAP